MKKLTSWAIASLLALTLASCGGDALSLEAQVAQAATKTSRAESMRFWTTMRITIPGSAPTEVEGTGVGTADGRRAEMTMELPNVDGEDLGSVTVLMLDLDMYMQMEFLRREAPELKPWIKIDLEALGKQTGFDLDAVMDWSRNNPTTQLDYLRGAGRVEEVGREDVRGVETTRYHAVVDLEKAARQTTGPRAEEAARALRELIKLTGVKTQPMDVWIDDDSLVRRVKFDQTIKQGPARSKTAMTMEMYDFGAPVRVTAPPAKDVMTLAELEALANEGSP